MYEIKTQDNYEVYNKSVNPDTFEWKKHDISKFKMNKHDLYEIELDLSYAVLNGTQNHHDKMSEAISRF